MPSAKYQVISEQILLFASTTLHSKGLQRKMKIWLCFRDFLDKSAPV